MHRPFVQASVSEVRSVSPSAPVAPQRVVALVSNMAWSIYNYRIPVIHALRSAGYHVVVIAPVDESVSKIMEDPGVEFVPLVQFRRNTTNIWAALRMIAEFRRVYRKIQPDLVIHYGVQANIFGNAGAWLAGVRSVCVVTGLGYTFLHQGWLARLTRWLYRFSFLYPRKVVFENNEDMHLMTRRRMVSGKLTLRVPGCGIDTRLFVPIPALRAPDAPVFLFMGRLLYDKGLREFAEAAACLKQRFPLAECWVLGGLDDENPAHIQRSELVGWVKAGIIQYKGVVDDVRPMIAQADWIVLPSYREGLSKVLLEAMSMEKPIITTDAPGCKETVAEGENGFLVPARNAKALLAAMEKACTLPPDQVQVMGKRSRQRVVQHYDAALVGKAYLQMVQQLI